MHPWFDAEDDDEEDCPMDSSSYNILLSHTAFSKELSHLNLYPLHNQHAHGCSSQAFYGQRMDVNNNNNLLKVYNTEKVYFNVEKKLKRKNKC